MATNTPSTGTSRSAFVLTSRSTMPVTSPFWVSLIVSITLFQATVILGLARALSCMIFEPRSASRRCTSVTRDANFVRKIASSRAESPPPTTAMGLPLKKKPSQVAHVDTPRPISARSAGSPSSRAEAPVATISALAVYVASDVTTRNGRAERSADVTSPATMSAPNRSAWARISAMRSGPMTPFLKPGKFSTSVVIMSCPPADKPSMTSGFKLALAV